MTLRGAPCSQKRGGNLFKSEKMLQSFGTAECDLIEPVNQIYRDRGLSAECRVPRRV